MYSCIINQHNNVYPSSLYKYEFILGNGLGGLKKEIIRNMYKKRNYKIDMIRGMASILVVLGHCFQYIPHANQDGLYYVIYTFHMPLFFIISGVLDQKYTSLNKAVIRIKKLLSYYIYYSLIDFAWQMITQSNKFGGVSEFISTKINRKMLLSILLATRNSIFSKFWFFSALAGVCIIRFLVDSLTKNEKQRDSISLVIFILGLAYARYIHVGLPISFEVSMVASGFYWFGIKMKKYFCENKLDDLGKKLAIVSTIFLIAIYIEKKFNMDLLSFWCVHWSNTIFMIITSISGSLIVCILAYLIKDHKCLIYIGKDSQIVYGLHFIAINIVAKIWSMTGISNMFISSIAACCFTGIIIYCFYVFLFIAEKAKLNKMGS